MLKKLAMKNKWCLEVLGAKIYRTPTEAAYENHESHTSLAKK